MGFTVFRKEPTSAEVRAFLGRTFARNKAKPKYLICDRGPQFDCPGFETWCRHRSRNIKVRYGAVGQHGSIAVLERLILSLKNECTRKVLVPLARKEFRREIAAYFGWYNEARPHTTLRGATPDEVYRRKHPACRHPRFEPRERWPRGSPCAAPRVPRKGRAGVQFHRFAMKVRAGDVHEPIRCPNFQRS